MAEYQHAYLMIRPIVTTEKVNDDMPMFCRCSHMFGVYLVFVFEPVIVYRDLPGNYIKHGCKCRNGSAISTQS